MRRGSGSRPMRIAGGAIGCEILLTTSGARSQLVWNLINYDIGGETRVEANSNLEIEWQYSDRQCRKWFGIGELRNTVRLRFSVFLSLRKKEKMTHYNHGSLWSMNNCFRCRWQWAVAAQRQCDKFAFFGERFCHGRRRTWDQVPNGVK